MSGWRDIFGVMACVAALIPSPPAVAADPTVEPILKKLQDARDKARAAHTAGDQPKQ